MKELEILLSQGNKEEIGLNNDEIHELTTFIGQDEKDS